MAGTVTTDFAFFSNGADTSNCTATTNWVTAGTPDTETFVEGTASLSAKVSATTFTSVYTFGAPVDLSDKLLVVWMNCATPNKLATKAAGGLRIRVVDASAYWAEWYVAGNNTYFGGWRAFVIRTNQTPSATSATPPVYSAITKAGVVCTTTSSVAKTNFWWDALRYGTYMQIYAGTSGSPATWDDFITYENTNAIGMLSREEGILYVQSKILIGSTSAGVATYFKDTNEVVVFRDNVFGTDFYEIRGQGNSTGTTEIYFGTKSGSAGISGGMIRSAGTSKVVIDMNDTYITKLGLYGVTLYACSTAYLPVYSADREALNCTWESSAEVQVSTCIVKYCNFITPTDAGGASGAILISSESHAVSYCNFISCADGWHVDTVGTYPCIGNKFVGNTYDIGNSSAGLVTINATALADPSTYENTGGGSVVISSPANLTINIVDEDGDAITSACEVTVVKESDLTELYHAENVVTGTTDYPYTSGAGTSTYINVVNVSGYVAKTVNGYTLLSGDATLSIQLDVDRAYLNP